MQFIFKGYSNSNFRHSSKFNVIINTLSFLEQITAPKDMFRNQKSLKADLAYKNSIAASSNKEESTNQSRSFFNYKKYLKPALNEEEITEIKTIFDLFDTDGTGLISPQDLMKALDSIGYKGKQNTVYQQILDLTSDGAGNIEFSTFLTMLTTRVTEYDSRQDMNQLFKMFDDDKCGYISIKNLRRCMRELDIDVQEQQMQKMIECADKDRDGRVNEEEFYFFLTGKYERDPI